MHEMQNSKICGLCLEVLERLELLGELERNMLNDILPEVNVNLFADQCICENCTKQLFESYEFKRHSLEANTTSETFVKCDTISVQSLDYDLTNNGQIDCLLKQEGVPETCCVCCRTTLDEEVNTSLIPSEVTLEMLERCLPELANFYSVSLPMLCEKCMCFLENMFTFINVCLEVEDKINHSYDAYTVNSEDYVHLYQLKSMKTEIEDVKAQTDVFSDGSHYKSVIEAESKYENDNSFVETFNNEASGFLGNSEPDLDIRSPLDFYEKALLIMLLIRRRRANKRRRRRFWVDPLGAERFKKGMYYNLYKDLRRNGDRFLEHFGMSIGSFDELLSVIKEGISGKDTAMRKCVPAEEKLALTLRYLRTGCTMKALHLEFRLGISTISLIVHQVCNAIWRLMKDICIPSPTDKRWLEIAEGFDRDLNFPNCIGAIDVKEVRVVKPRNDGSFHFLAICDSKFRFTYTEVGGSALPCLMDSELHRKYVDGTIGIPLPRPLRDSGVITPFMFVGGKDFTITKYLIRPYSGRKLSAKKEGFNGHLSRARRPIDIAFAIFSNKWKIFHRALDVSSDFADDIVRCCSVLHNFILDRDAYNFEDTLVIEGLVEIDRIAGQGGRAANSIRDDLANYFLSSDGEVTK